MREFAPSSLSLAGSILLAHPGMMDPNFRRAVLFISTNDPQEGAFGLTLNRPAGRTVGELLAGREVGALGNIPVFLGGPVSTDQLIFASFQWHDETERLECNHHLVIEEAEERMGDASTIVRAFVGYAGWTKGQLEGELAQRAWLVQKATREVLDLERCPRLWREMTSGFGPWFQLVAEAPEDMSKN